MDGTTKKEMVFVAGSAMAPKPDWSSESWTGWTTWKRKASSRGRRRCCTTERFDPWHARPPAPESHKIAQDRTTNSIDCALQINYWRNGRVELHPPLGWALFLSSVISIPTFFHPHGDTNVPTITTTQDSANSSPTPDKPYSPAATRRSRRFWPKRTHLIRWLPLPPALNTGYGSTSKSPGRYQCSA